MSEDKQVDPLPQPSAGRRFLIYFHETMRCMSACIAPAVIAIGCALLMWKTEPANDMLAQMALEFFYDWPTRIRVGIFLLCVIAQAACCWYWARTTLMFRQALPPIYSPAVGEKTLLSEAHYYAKARPWVVEWVPRVIGAAPFLGWAFGLCNASSSFRRVSDDAAMTLNWWSAAPAALCTAFLYILYKRRQWLRARTKDGAPAEQMSSAPWAMDGAIDPRADLKGVCDLLKRSGLVRRRRATRQRLREKDAWRGVNVAALILSLLVTVVFVVWAPWGPVTLGDALGGLGVPIIGATVLVPWFSALLITGRARRWPLGAFAFLLMILITPVNSFIGRHFDVRIDNHDVRTLHAADGTLPERPRVTDVLSQWANQQGSSGAEYSYECVRAAGVQFIAACREPAVVQNCRLRANCDVVRERPPFIIAAAEGGASRAGYWTALTLGEMIRRDPGSRESIFAISAVSGGALGAVLIRALIDVDRVQQTRFKMAADKRVVCKDDDETPADQAAPYASCIRLFMKRDFLASAFVGMFFTDVEQRFVQASLVALHDRAATIEQAWETSWDDLIEALSFDDADPSTKSQTEQFKKEFKGLFAKGFIAAFNGAPDVVSSPLRHGAVKPWPVLLLNGTIVESGRRAITSNVQVRNASVNQGKTDLDEPCYLGIGGIDQLTGKPCLIWANSFVEDPLAVLNRDIPISTAANMSARFPVVQPAGGVRENDRGRRRFHVVDGGVYENFGATTIHDLLSFVATVSRLGPRSEQNLTGGLRPLVVLISTDHDLDGVRQFAPAYGGFEDTSKEKQERKMILGCNLARATQPESPNCDRESFASANEVLGVPFALYQTRSGRGEQAILSVRERLAQQGYLDTNFFHFRQCVSTGSRPASMTWFVSSFSRKAMESLLPSLKQTLTKPGYDYSFIEWRALLGTPGGNYWKNDPCQNHDELKRFLDRIELIRQSRR